MLSAEYTGHGGTFLVAEDTVFYLDTDGRLCSRDLKGKSKKILADKQVKDIKYRKGWLYYIDLDNWYLLRVASKGGEPQLIIEETIDNYYLTDETIVYQTGYCTPMEYDRLEKDGSSKYYFKELGANGETEILMEGDLKQEQPYYYNSSYCIIQLVLFDKTGLYYTIYNEKKSSTYLFKNFDGEKTKLSDFLIDEEVFPTIILDDGIYSFCYKHNVAGSENFYRIAKDGGKEEKLGGLFSNAEIFTPALNMIDA